MNRLPCLYMKTPTRLEYINDEENECEYEVQTYIETSAYKNEKGHWISRVEETTVKEYSPSEFVEEYNKRHKKETITVEMVRKFAKEGTIKARKENRKWVILESPRKKIKL